jgi:hypothetical protein
VLSFLSSSTLLNTSGSGGGVLLERNEYHERAIKTNIKEEEKKHDEGICLFDRLSHRCYSDVHTIAKQLFE